ncbi:dynein regulatory complex subunit 7-like [Diprion similis]|uniref:dynein regulatory complex subunit 7-like n=1 Tax=Diprion similis TaxID=362088 RepID=UPI001EF853F2|nr:dynein regulatory complex subunit 7-like [Diprion similis]
MFGTISDNRSTITDAFNIDMESKSQVKFDQDVWSETLLKNSRRRSTSTVPGISAINRDHEYDDDESEGSEVETNARRESEYTGPFEISAGILKQIRQELCLIQLSWPPEIKCIDIDENFLPSSYNNNSDKEKLLLWYTENFRKQYHTIYANRKPLLFARDNECGIHKFVSTTIRPSTLPYPELSTWQGCAKFVSDYLTYEPPRNPILMVSFPLNFCLPAPVSVRSVSVSIYPIHRSPQVLAY